MGKGAWKDAIHIFGYETQRLLYQVHTGVFFQIDSLVEEVLACAGNAGKEEIIAGLSSRHRREAIAQVLSELEDQGIISFASPPLPEENEDASCRGASAPLPISITLHVSHGCNLRCAYCFASGGAYGSKPAIMTPAVARQAVNWLLSESMEAGRCHVDFFGGEPLLNFGLIVNVISYARNEARKRNVEISFGLTTNGTILTPAILEVLVQEKIGIVFSLDGAPRTHDRIRTFHNGSGTHDAVAQSIRKLISMQPDRVILRATMTSRDLAIDEISGHLAGFGPSEVDIAPVVVPPDNPLAIRPKHLAELRRQLKKLSKRELRALLRDEPVPSTRFQKAIHQLLARHSKDYGCGGGRTFFAVSADGAISFCSSLAGHPEFRMGDVFNGFDSDKVQQLGKVLPADRRKACADCWARYLCGGGCIYDALMAGGTPTIPNPVSCEIIRYTYELAMGICLQLHTQHSSTFECLSEAAD